MKHWHVSVAALLAGMAPLTAYGQASTELEKIVLSAGFTPIPVEAYGRAFSVITAEELHKRGIVTVQDALRTLPGVAVTSTGEANTQVRIRGGEGNHVLVLIDGVEANSTGSGEYIFSGLEVTDIERIEVLRGPQSTLYGSNAMAGVISIVTRRAEGPGTQYGGGFELGTDGTVAGDIFVRQRGQRGELSFSAGARHAGGFDQSRSGGDKDSNDRETLNLTGEYRLADSVTTGFTLRRTWQRFDYDEPHPDTDWQCMDPPDCYDWQIDPGVAGPEYYLMDSPVRAERNERFGSLWLQADALDGRVRNRLSLSGNRQDRTDQGGRYPLSYDRGSQWALKYLASYGIDGTADSARHRLNLAAEHETETYRNSWNPGPVDYERNTDSLALEYQGRLESGIDLQGGLRHDSNDVFQDATTWNLAFSYRLAGADVRLRGSVGKAVVNPTMIEQFGYTPGQFEGNPDLRPESNLGADIGADIGFGAGRGVFGVSLFRNNVKDTIVGSGMSSINLPGTSTRQGVEASLEYAAADWLRLAGGYTYTDARASDGSVLTGRPRHELGLSATADTFGGRGTVAADLRHVAGNYDREFWRAGYAPVAELPAFTAVNLTASYDLNDRVQLTGRITNLFDTEYSEAWGYFAQGRTAYVGLRAKW